MRGSLYQRAAQLGRPLRWLLFRDSLAVCQGCGAPARWHSAAEARHDDWCETCLSSGPDTRGHGGDYDYYRWGWSRRAQEAQNRVPERVLRQPAQAEAPEPLVRPHFDAARQNFDAFGDRLTAIKNNLDPDFRWYPYSTLANFIHLEAIVPEEYDFLFAPRKYYADFGAADGALSFYLESLGHAADIYDYASTNMNGLEGASRLKAALGSNVGIIECDLDSQFAISRRYDVIFFLGLLYHLKNPFYVLERLSSATAYMFCSTRVARHFHAAGEDVSAQSAAYLLGPEESNNDATNFWIFTNAGLKRLFHRTGWDVIAFCNVGETTCSNPQDDHLDERAFALLKSRHC